jgi:hypothetical protein
MVSEGRRPTVLLSRLHLLCLVNLIRSYLLPRRPDLSLGSYC